MSPDTRQHRGPHPEDRRLFAAERLPAVRAAVSDLSWLLTRGYTVGGTLKAVGDRYALDARQRTVVTRASCSDQTAAQRVAALVAPEAVRGRDLVIDGFNLVVTVEAALGGGLLFVCRDGCVRDLSSVHGHYRHVAETGEALHLAGEQIARLGAASVLWLLDRPVSNSGRLAERIREEGAGFGWPWTVEVVMDPDAVIPGSGRIAVTSDGPVLDRVRAWTNVAGQMVDSGALHGWLLDLSEKGGA